VRNSERSSGVVSRLVRSLVGHRSHSPARPAVRFVKPQLEILEDRNVLAVTITLPQGGGNVNISKQNDNQAEATIAIDPTQPNQVFAASMTFHGSANGTFDGNVDVPGVWTNHTEGLYAATSPTGGIDQWSGGVILTGGPTEGGTNKAPRSLPAAHADPQAAFDDYGNLYLTYTSNINEFGKATAGGGATLTDDGRQWQQNMWAGRILIIRPTKPNQELAIITGNNATQITVAQNWNQAPAVGDSYEIVSGIITPQGALIKANAIVLLRSVDDGQSFQFLQFMDTGPQATMPVDYPAVATGPGRTIDEKSVWLAWRGAMGRLW
jgi:hypothetical protein